MAVFEMWGLRDTKRPRPWVQSHLQGNNCQCQGAGANDWEESHMDDWLIVVLVIAAVIVLGLIIWAATRRTREKRVEKRRAEATEHRQEAQVRAREAGAEELEARRHSEEARQRREQAEELEDRAAKRDPDSPRS